jgi:hypothetical protein
VSIVDKIKEHRNNVPKELEGIDELDSTTKDYMLYKFLKDKKIFLFSLWKKY